MRITFYRRSFKILRLMNTTPWCHVVNTLRHYGAHQSMLSAHYDTMEPTRACCQHTTTPWCPPEHVVNTLRHYGAHQSMLSADLLAQQKRLFVLMACISSWACMEISWTNPREGEGGSNEVIFLQKILVILKRMFPRYYMHSDMFRLFKSLTMT